MLCFLKNDDGSNINSRSSSSGYIDPRNLVSLNEAITKNKCLGKKEKEYIPTIIIILSQDYKIRKGILKEETLQQIQQYIAEVTVKNILQAILQRQIALLPRIITLGFICSDAISLYFHVHHLLFCNPNSIELFKFNM